MSTQVYFVTYAKGGISNQRVEGQTPDQILEFFGSMYQELKSADVVVNGDQVTFELRSGSKAADVYFVTYAKGGVSNQRVEGQTPDQILEFFSSMYQELKSADVVVNGDQVTFELRSGSKAADVYFVTYAKGGISNQRVEGQTPDQILEFFGSMYQELKSADVVVNGDQVTFELRSGSKANV